jgi:transaldolase/glucose-6-phosphate isomerase
VNGTPTLAGYLAAHLNRLNEGDYFALLAYIEMNEAHERVLQEIRQGIRDVRRVGMCLEFGPRFLTQLGRPTRVARTQGCSYRSRAMTPSICRCRDGSTPLVWSRRPRREEISTFWWSAIRRALRPHLGANVAGGLITLRVGLLAALGLDRLTAS